MHDYISQIYLHSLFKSPCLKQNSSFILCILPPADPGVEVILCVKWRVLTVQVIRTCSTRACKNPTTTILPNSPGTDITTQAVILG